VATLCGACVSRSVSTYRIQALSKKSWGGKRTTSGMGQLEEPHFTTTGSFLSLRSCDPRDAFRFSRKEVLGNIFSYRVNAASSKGGCLFSHRHSHNLKQLREGTFGSKEILERCKHSNHKTLLTRLYSRVHPLGLHLSYGGTNEYRQSLKMQTRPLRLPPEPM
jgi:hypothetical protein